MNVLNSWSRRFCRQALLREYKNDCQHWELCRRLFSTPPSQFHGLWEPNDLKLEPDIPEYKVLHVRMRGYDFPVLEAFAKMMHQTVDKILDVENDAWASPARCSEVRTFHPQSTTVSEKYQLQKYDRAIMMENVPTTKLPVLLDFMKRFCPEGVEVNLYETDTEEEEFRYVPNYEVLDLQAEKAAIEAGKLRKP